MTRPKLQVIIDKFEKDSISIKQAERERERERERDYNTLPALMKLFKS